jgi:ribonucleoside-triphosphate reductase (thioredoxin)
MGDGNMELDKKILSDIVVHTKYARHLEKKERRENWKELVTRNKEMHQRKYPQLFEEIENVYNNFVLTKKVLPSMRSMQFGGRPIELNHSRVYNCAFLPVDSIYSFSEAMFLLLGGTGVGYSVQRHHVENLPEIRKPNYNYKRKYVIQDSIMGWADAIKTLFKSYTGVTSSHIDFDYSDIREKGALLITAGGKAPGPEPLRLAITKIEGMLREKTDRSQLTTLESHDIMCHIADAVLAGGIRRAAMISLFNIDDSDMLSCKSGNWYDTNPQRGRANNSVVILRHRITENKFKDVWERIQASGAGEPGIYFTNDMDWGTNPCCEISLRAFQFCNLTEINMSTIADQEDFNERASAASLLGTLQAGYTDFHYLRDIWRRTTEKDALLGVSMTGIASKSNMLLDYKQATIIVNETNKQIANIIGIKSAARTTSVKPAGTTSLVLGTSSGIHAWHNDFYLRRMRVGKDESIYTYLKENHPNLVEDEFFRPDQQAVISVPQRAPKGAITRHESPIDLLERVKFISTNWVRSGYRKGQNHHNVSCTVSVKDEEWEMVGEWMWKNRLHYNGLSVLPYHGGTYKQTPFQDITEKEYWELYNQLTDIDLTKVVEKMDNTELAQEIACGGVGGCEI